MSKSTGALLGATALLLSACAATPGHMRLAQADPLERFNRGVYGFNKGADRVIVKPVSKVYTTVTPKAAQRGLRNVFNNVDEPFNAINSLLQGKPKDFFHTMGRFLVNTVLGVGGLADHATDMGLEERPEDLGQTFAVWGVNSGPFIMLPFFGPSTFRDAAGTGAEFLGADPYRQFQNTLKMSTAENWGLNALEISDKRAYLAETTDTLLKTSLDEYATMRSAYLQFRQSMIYDGAPPEDDDIAAPAPPSDVPADQPAPEIQPVPDSMGTKKPAEASPTSPPLPPKDGEPVEPVPQPKSDDQKGMNP